MTNRSYKPYAKAALIIGALYTYARVAWVMGALYMGDCIGESIERERDYTIQLTADAERGQYNIKRTYPSEFADQMKLDQALGKIGGNLESMLTERINGD